MTRKAWLWVTAVLLLAGVSLYLNRDWFAKDSIRIYSRSRPMRGGLSAMFSRRRSTGAATDQGAINPITFGFDRRLKLTDIKVVPLSAIQTNKYPQPIWHIISESNSIPTKDFYYGQSIKGMHPAIKGALPDPLEPGVEYRLFIESQEFKGEHDFVPVAKTQ